MSGFLRSTPGNGGTATRRSPLRQRLLAAAALAVLAGSAAGCGTGDSGTGSGQAGSVSVSSPAAPATVPAPPTSAAPAADPAAGVPLPGLTDIPVAPAAPSPPPAPEPEPVAVTVEGTGIDLDVVAVGVESDGAMTLPDNHVQAGWYRFGPAPGAPAGAAVLAAHVDSETEQLPIAALDDVSPGTTVSVTRSDGSTLRYQTQEVRNIPKNSLSEFNLFDRSGDHRLLLVTCGGKWLPAEADYEDNVVLTAVPVR